MNLFTASGALVIGLVLLAYGADRFVRGAAALARHLGISPLLVGLTLVALGTSMPEVIVAIFAAARGNSGIALGNAVGSNIANIGLVLGITALVMPLKIASKILQREYVVLFAVTTATLLFMWNGVWGRWDGIALLCGCVLFFAWLVWTGLQQAREEKLSREFAAEFPATIPVNYAVFWFFLGAILLPLGAEMLVRGAVFIATWFGVSDLVVGLTIVAIGTSLPELATSIAAAIKKEHEMILGNILGSNIFNLLLVLPMPGLISPGKIAPNFLYRDLFAMFIFTALLFFIAKEWRAKPGRITRLEGGLLVIGYIVYLTVLIIGTT